MFAVVVVVVCCVRMMYAPVCVYLFVTVFVFCLMDCWFFSLLSLSFPFFSCLVSFWVFSAHASVLKLFFCFLSSVFFFHHLRKSLVQCLTECAYKDRDVIFHEGDVGDAFYMVRARLGTSNHHICRMFVCLCVCVSVCLCVCVCVCVDAYSLLTISKCFSRMCVCY
jgi:hypothetical protein